jgi:hypothetical protein
MIAAPPLPRAAAGDLGTASLTPKYIETRYFDALRFGFIIQHAVNGEAPESPRLRK